MKNSLKFAARGASGALMALSVFTVTGYAQTVVAVKESPDAREADAQRRVKLIAESPLPLADQDNHTPEKYYLRASDRAQRGRPDSDPVRAPSVLPELVDSVPAEPAGKVVKTQEDPKSGD